MRDTQETLHYRNEEEFYDDYLKITDKKEQVNLLLKYRKWVSSLNQSYANIMKILAEGLYSDRSHRFFLELLQNADDNDYSAGLEPLVEFNLNGNTLTIRNNEIGFSAENVYSITTAALSTKYRTNSNAYIGEKGIGFKSVFAVADKVEIHSNGYHFYLLNNEYIFPHWIDKPYNQHLNTEIILHLRNESNLPERIEDHLRDLSHQTLGMILFLSKLRRIRITTNSLISEDIQIKDKGKYRSIYTNDRLEGCYYIYRYTRTVGIAEIKSRYDKLLDGKTIDHWNREIIFAVPDPNSMDVRNFKGYYFAFLQTNMETGLPIHIQVDAHTTSNRERYIQIEESSWNARIMEGLIDELANLYQALAQDKNFVRHLPIYFPKKSRVPANANEDAIAIYQHLQRLLVKLPIFCNNAGKLCCNHEVVMLPHDGSEIFYPEPKYEKYIGDCIGDKKTASKMYFVRHAWNRDHKPILSEYGVKELEYIDYFTLLKSGPPLRVNIKDYLSVVEFNNFLINTLRKIKSYDRLGEYQKDCIKSAKVFPVRQKDKERTWMSATGTKEIRWQNVKSKTAQDPSKSFLYIDAEFTYSPGGSTKNREGISKNNQEYREFLGYIGLSQHSVINLLIDNHVNPLKGVRSLSPSEAHKHWVALYDGYWKNRKTLENINKTAFIELTELLPQCKVPVLIPLSEPKNDLVRVKDSYIDNHYHAQRTKLYEVYQGIELPIINMSNFSPKANIKWNDYMEFFATIGAHSGAYLMESDIKKNPWINISENQRIKTDDKNLQTLTPFLRAIAETVMVRNNHRDTGDYFDLHVNSGGIHYRLDQLSHILLRNDHAKKSDYLAKRISKDLFESLKLPITINASWKYNTTPSQVTAPNCYFETYIAPYLCLKEALTGKFVKTSQPLFYYSRHNREMLDKLVAYVKDSDYNGNLRFLEACGVKREVEAKDVQFLLERSTTLVLDDPSDDNLKNYITHLQMLCRYLKSTASDKSVITKNLKLFNPSKSVLQMPHKWLDEADCLMFGIQLVEDLRKLLQDRDDMNVAELINNLCTLEHKTDSRLLRLLVAIGGKIRLAVGENKETLLRNLRNSVQSLGIGINGKRILAPHKLPTIWLFYFGFDQEDADEIDVWPLPPETLTENVKTIITALDWPTSEQLPCSPESYSCFELSPLDYRKLDKCYPSTNRDVNDVLNPLLKEVMSMIKNRSIVIHEGLYFSVAGKKMPVRYALWDKLYLSDDVTPLFSLLSDMGGPSPEIMRQIWHNEEFFRDQSNSRTEENDKAKQEKQGRNSNAGYKSDQEDTNNNNSNTSHDSQSNANAGNGNGDRTRSSREQGPHIFYRSGIYSGKPTGADSSRQDTARLGEQIVIDYETKAGRKAALQKTNNPGFDILSESEEEKRYIEVKTVNGGWKWVLLTKTEFETARERGAEYWIYVVEIYEDGKHCLTTLNDPYNKVNYYSLDDGWKDIENSKHYSSSSAYDDLYS